MFSAILLGVAVILIVYRFTMRRKNLSHVPGPRSFPILGSFLHLDPKHPHISMAQLAKEHGSVYRLNFQGKPCVIVCGFEALYQVLVRKSADFAGRPSIYLIDVLTEGQAGIGRTDAGPEHYARRKLVHRYLKQHGEGMQKMEQVTLAAVKEMVQGVCEVNGKPVDIGAMLFHCVAETMAILMIGETIGQNAIDKVQDVFQAETVALGKSLAQDIVNNFPFMRYLPNPAYHSVMKSVDLKNSLIGKWIASKPQHGLIGFMQGLSAEEKIKHYIPEMKNQVQVPYELLDAGVVTTTVTLSVLMNVLAQRSDVQDRLRQENKEVLGKRPPCLADREKMPYHMATLLEINRYASIVPLSLPHQTVRDTCVQSDGKTVHIPAGTEVLPHLWSMHHDQEFWQDSFHFDPERFLDSGVRLVDADHPNRTHLMPFGAGQRVCIAEVFAMSRMFLILSHMIQSFRVLPESTPQAQPSHDPRHMEYGVIMLPPKFKVRLEQY